MLSGCALLVWCCTWVVAAARGGHRACMVYGMHALASSLFTVVPHDSSGVSKLCDASQVFAWSVVLLPLSAAADM